MLVVLAMLDPPRVQPMDVTAGLRVAPHGSALGYLPEVDAELRDRFNRVLGTLVRLVGGH